MARRKAANGSTKAAVDASSTAATESDNTQASNAGATNTSSGRLDILAASAAITDREPIKINNMNAADLKNACDDAVKRVRSKPAFSFLSSVLC